MTEPSISGAHDLKRVLSLARHFAVPAKLCVNRWDPDPETTRHIEAQTRGSGATVVGRIRYDPTVTQAQVQGKTVVEQGGPAADDIRALWQRVGRISAR